MVDNPQLVETCCRWLDAGDYIQVAQLARTRGLPPHLRAKAWPILLANHPFVQNPYIVPEYPSGDGDEMLFVAPNRHRIMGDLSRARQRSRTSPPPAPISPNPQTQTPATSFCHAQQDSTSQHSSSQTLSTPSSSNDTAPSSNSIPRSSISVERRQADSSITVVHHPTCTTTAGRSGPASPIPSPNDGQPRPLKKEASDIGEEDPLDAAIVDAIQAFLNKWGKYAPYDPGMVYVGVALGEWVDPQEIPDFSGLVEHALLVLLHGPPNHGDGPSGPCDSPLAQQISFFLGTFRKLLPELKDHFDDEELLGLGGDEWLLWWIKWAGARVWHPIDRARVWDMYFGWTGQPTVPSTDGESNGDSAAVSPFWSLDPTAPVLELHIQHIFVCLAALKSKRAVLLELDQSEIRQFLARFAKFDDTESIIAEAGEIWRSWHWAEESDE